MLRTRAPVVAASLAAASCLLLVRTDDLAGAGGEGAGSVPARGVLSLDADVDGGLEDAGPKLDGAPDGTSDGALDPALVARWPLDEGASTTAGDRTGHGHDGTLSSGSTWSASPRRGAVSFDGFGGHISVANGPGLSFGDPMTVAFWVNADDVAASDERLLAMGAVWNIKLNGSSRFPQLTVLGIGYAQGDRSLPAGEWHHIAFTFTAGTVAGYFDGQAMGFLANTVPKGSRLGSDTSGFVMGAHIDLTTPCKCRIDEVRLYSRGLSQPEIAQLAQ